MRCHASARAGNLALVQDEVTGLLFDPEDAAAMAQRSSASHDAHALFGRPPADGAALRHADRPVQGFAEIRMAAGVISRCPISMRTGERAANTRDGS